METFSDEFIEYWADRYIGYGIQFLSNGDGEPLTFGEFIEQPWMYMDLLLQGLGLPVTGNSMRPLLRADLAGDVMRQEIEQMEGEGDEVRRPIRLCGRRLIQRLNPFAHPKLVKCGGHGRAKPCA